MGMFDTIICEYPLPDEWENANFQSKDLKCELDTYVITSGGRLVLKRDSSVTDTNHHGFLYFYDFPLGSYDVRLDGAHRYSTLRDDARLITYEAKFTDGQLVEIKRLP